MAEILTLPVDQSGCRLGLAMEVAKENLEMQIGSNMETLCVI